jgi:glycosyltransferase involved in cell wall biosynthesis
MTEPKRWLTAIPLEYFDQNGAFFRRDAGALCLAFRALGIPSKLVALGAPTESENPPLILCKPAQMADAGWWREQKAAWVVLYSWAAPRYEPVARAIKESGARLMVRMDTDGIKSPHVHFWRYLAITRSAERDAGRLCPTAYALTKSLFLRWIHPAVEQGMMRHLAHADHVLIESRLARQYFSQLCHKFGRPDIAARLHVAPHPAMVESPFSGNTSKLRHIVAVGRWAADQKDAPTLMQALALALPAHPNYSVDLIGSGDDVLRQLIHRLPLEIQQRIRIHGTLEHQKVQDIYRQSRIILFSSRYEGFPISAAEALCCGCTVVGPCALPSLNHIGSLGAATLAVSRHPRDLADALACEIETWESGDRDPVASSRYWFDRLSVKASAQHLLKLSAGAQA